MKMETERELAKARAVRKGGKLLRVQPTDYDGWLAILMFECPEGGYEDLTAAFTAACRRAINGEKYVVRQVGNKYIRIR
jgi:hypothetical protein